MPTTVIVDRKGNVRWSHSGYKAGDETEYLNQIRARCGRRHRIATPSTAAAPSLLVDASGCCAPRALGQALRAREPRGPDHGHGTAIPVSSSYMDHVFRLARGRARRRPAARAADAAATDRDGHSRSRLLLLPASGHWPPCCPTTAPTSCTTATTAAASPSTGPSVLVRKKFGERFRGHRQLLRRHDLQRVDRRGHHGESLRRGAHAEGPRRRLPARQDHLLRWFTNSERKRLQRRHGESVDQPGHVRRPDDGQLGFSRGWDDVGKRGDAISRKTWTGASTASTSRRSPTRTCCCGCTTRRSPRKASSTTPTARCVSWTRSGARYSYAVRRSTRARAPATPASRAAVLPALPCGARGRLPLLHRHLGHRGHTADVSYTHPLRDEWTFDVPTASTRQNAADFYSDLFPRELPELPGARQGTGHDASHTLGVGVGYEFKRRSLSFLNKATLNLQLQPHHVRLRRLPRPARPTGVAPGTEPLYTFDANVIQLLLLCWF